LTIRCRAGHDLLVDEQKVEPLGEEAPDLIARLQARRLELLARTSGKIPQRTGAVFLGEFDCLNDGLRE
jgi:hypothetical protein